MEKMVIGFKGEQASEAKQNFSKTDNMKLLDLIHLARMHFGESN